MLISATVFAALLALMAFAIPASAGETRVVSVSFGSAGSGDGQVSLAEHSGLAVNETTHDVYVADTGNHRVDQFDSAGNFIRAFGADVGGAGVDVCTSGCVSGTSASTPGAFEAPTFIAVDNSSSASKSDVYVADTSSNILTKFEADGTLVSSWGAGGQLNGSTAPSGPFTEIAGIAVDSAGVLAVFEAEPHLLFQFSESGAFSAESGETPRGSAQAGLAVDPNGDFFKVNAALNVEKFKASGTDIGQVNSLESTTGLAVDPSSGELFVDNGGSIDNYAFGPSGEVIGSGCTPAPFEGCAPTSSFGSGDLSAGAGLTVDGASEIVYAADTGAGEILGFETVFLPSATTEAAGEIDNDSAVLHGTLNPDGGPEASCKFQYTTESSFQSEGFASATSIPCSPAGPFTGSAAQAVSGEASGLSSSTGYRFRILAGNENGSRPGQALGFRTPGLPLIASQSVEAVGISDAAVSAQINPKGAKTTYHVEYGTTSSYGQSTAESLPIGFEGDESPHTVNVHIGGLSTGTAYHFRFVATNVAGSAAGTDTTFATYPTTSTFGPCPNDRFRAGVGARLSDCRAYEQATPIDKHGSNAQGSVDLIQASSAGNRVTFYVSGGLATSGGSSGLLPFMASRGPTGWSSDGLQPNTPPSRLAGVIGWSDDLATAVTTGPSSSGGDALYLRDADTAAFQLAAVSPTRLEAKFADIAADTSHLTFESGANLAPGAIPGEFNLYDLDHGTVTLPGRIPSGLASSCDDVNGPACEPASEGAFAGPYAWESARPDIGGASAGHYTQNTISRDGSRVFFTTRNAAQLYVREDATKTTRISASQAIVPDPKGAKPAAFMAATPDGSEVFFTSCEKLTDDSTAVSTADNRCIPGANENPQQGQDLYSYDVESGELTDLTVDSNASDPKGAAVQGVLGTSKDGSYVYFAANGVLAPGASPGDCVIGRNFVGQQCNLYVSHEGTTTFIASLSGGGAQVSDAINWVPSILPGVFTQKDSRISSGGRTLLFSSSRSLTGYDNSGQQELFRYTAPDEELTCVSCNPTGTPPSGAAALGTSRGFLHDGFYTFLTRNLSADGDRVFFDSPDALLPSDTNGVSDVYEWEAKGSGSCESESQNGGCLYLLSSGTSPDPSWFGDASADGDHAFLFTSQQLVPSDRDQLYDIYDVGVEAGLASQHALAPPTCASAACQANAAPPPDPPTSSATFSGPGNAKKSPAARKCPKGKRKVRSAGKVRCQKASKAKQHKRHNNRGGSK